MLYVIACIIFNTNILSITKLLFMLFMFDYIVLTALNILLEVPKLEFLFLF